MSPQKMDSIRSGYLYFLLVIVIAVIYYKNLFLPFIQDDWGWIYRFSYWSAAENFSEILNIEDKLFFRPVGQLYLYGLYLVFGKAPFVYHLSALIIHFINTVLVIAVLTRLIGDRFKAWLAGFLYAGAASLHLDTLSWTVGIYELGAMLFSLLTMWFYLRGRIIIGAVIFFLAVLCKEAVVVLPLILIVMDYYRQNQGQETVRFKSIVNKLAPLVPVIIVYIVYKFLGRMAYDLPAGNPYELQFASVHVLKNAYLYMLWGIQAVIPFALPFSRNINAAVFSVILILLIAVITWLVRREYKMRRLSPGLQQLLMFTTWVVIGLGPVFFLVRQSYRYYLTLSLPAFIMIGIILVGLLLEKFVRDKYRRGKLLIICTIVCLALSTYHIYRVHGEGINQTRLVHGTNYLIQRAHMVSLVREKLVSDNAQIAPGSLVVFENIELAAIGYDKGPKVWLGDNTIKVLALEKHRQDLLEFIKTSKGSSKIVCYRRVDGHLKRMSLDELNQM